MVFCCAAGNNGSNNLPSGVKNMGGKFGVTAPQPNQFYPSGYASTIEVSASYENDQITNFSNCGGKTQFVAPGMNILSTRPQNRYQLMPGTSMACPHVTGFMCLAYANLIRDYCSDLYSFGVNAPDILRIAGRKTADKLGAFADRSTNDCFGFGFPQCDKLNQELAKDHSINLTTVDGVNTIGTLVTPEDETEIIIPANLAYNE